MRETTTSTIGRSTGGVHGIEMQHLDDASLVRAVQSGEATAYAELYNRHEPAVRRLCARWLDDETAIDDVVQVAFVRAFEHIDQCTGDSRFSGWVQVIAHRLCIDTGRAAERARRGAAERAAASTPTTPEDPADTVLRHAQVDALQGAIASLPTRQREVVVARLVEGRRPSEIAAALGMSIAAVDSLLLRARRKLAAAYESIADERGGTSLGTAAAASAIGVSAHPDPLVRVAASAGRLAGNPAATLASATHGWGRTVRALAVAVAGAVGGAVFPTAADVPRPVSPPAVVVPAAGPRVPATTALLPPGAFPATIDVLRTVDVPSSIDLQVVTPPVKGPSPVGPVGPAASPVAEPPALPVPTGPAGPRPARPGAPTEPAVPAAPPVNSPAVPVSLPSPDVVGTAEAVFGAVTNAIQCRPTAALTCRPLSNPGGMREWRS